jgi:uncharacterized protein (TIGR02147 family)
VQKTGLQAYLHECFEQRRRARSHYSLRAYARDLKISVSELSLILNGRRNASYRTFVKVMESTKAPETIREELEREWKERRASILRKDIEVAPISPVLKVALDQLSIYRSSYTLTLWDILRLPEFSNRDLADGDFEEIARRLEITTSEVIESYEALRETGFLDSTPSSKLSSGMVLYPPGKPNPTIRNYHQQILNRLHTSIDKLGMEDRINLTAQLPICEGQFDEIREEFSRFQAEMIRKYARKSDGDNILVLTIAGMKCFTTPQGAPQ